MSSISFKRLNDPVLVHDWEALATSTSASPFARPGWFRAWALTFGQPVEVAVAGSGVLEAVAPVVRRGHGRIVAPVNGETPEYSVLASDPTARSSLLQGLMDEAWCGFEALKVSRDEAGAIATASGGRRVMAEVMQRSPFLKISGAWAEYESSLSANFRQGLRRKARRLDERGALALEVHDGTTNLDALLDQGFEVEPSEWKAEQGTAIASRPETRAFYSEVARQAAKRSWLRLWFARLDERPIAFRMDLLVDDVYYHLKGGYDPSFARFSPGLILQHESVRSAFREGARRYEFLGTDEPYKLRWTKTCHERLAVRSFGRGPRATGRWFARAAVRPTVHRLRSLGSKVAG